MTPTAAAGEPPLARLFAIGYRLLIDRLHDRLRARGWTDVRPAFGFVLLAARDQPTSVSELAALMGTTKQAASKLVETMVAAGYVQRGVGAEDGRQRPVQHRRRAARSRPPPSSPPASMRPAWWSPCAPPARSRRSADRGPPAARTPTPGG